MFRFNSNNILKLITTALVCAGIFTIFIFQWDSVETIYHFQSQTPQCPVSEMQMGCSTFSEHLSSLTNFLLAVIPNTTGSFLAFLLFLVFTAVFLKGTFGRTTSSPINNELRSLYYFRNNPSLHLFDYLKMAFARGILNPKIF